MHTHSFKSARNHGQQEEIQEERFSSIRNIQYSEPTHNDADIQGSTDRRPNMFRPPDFNGQSCEGIER